MVKNVPFLHQLNQLSQIMAVKIGSINISHKKVNRVKSNKVIRLIKVSVSEKLIQSANQKLELVILFQFNSTISRETFA